MGAVTNGEQAMQEHDDDPGSRLAVAVELARRAGDLTLRWFGSADLVVDTKADATPVTEADRAAERFLRQELARRFPHDGILGEEEGEHLGSSGRRWVIDPIDGTKAFTHGVPLYATLLALLDGGEPLLGVIHLPALGETVYAARGLGCWHDGLPARVRPDPPPGVANSWVMTSSVSTWSAHQLLELQGMGGHLRTWGDAYGYALVATGRAEAMVDPVAELWDLAPMPVIIGEAGGRFSAVGGSVDPAAGSGVASCGGSLHDELLGILER
jgi:histidinol-phosphatase